MKGGALLYVPTSIVVLYVGKLLDNKNTTTTSIPGEVVAGLHEVVAVNQHDFPHAPLVVRRPLKRAVRDGLDHRQYRLVSRAAKNNNKYAATS
jgi:hypothetical protein